jgi:hypothetical protein
VAGSNLVGLAFHAVSCAEKTHSVMMSYRGTVQATDDQDNYEINRNTLRWVAVQSPLSDVNGKSRSKSGNIVTVYVFWGEIDETE